VRSRPQCYRNELPTARRQRKIQNHQPDGELWSGRELGAAASQTTPVSAFSCLQAAYSRRRIAPMKVNHPTLLLRAEVTWVDAQRGKQDVKILFVAVGTSVDPAPPAQIRTGRIAAYGSYLGYLASKRRLGWGWRILALGIH
jgi:hypothetical protein